MRVLRYLLSRFLDGGLLILSPLKFSFICWGRPLTASLFLFKAMCLRYRAHGVGIYKRRLVLLAALYVDVDMLMLMFQIKEEPWAIAADEVDALEPLAALQMLPYSAGQFAGLLNYHGEQLPVVDVSAFVSGEGVPQALSTRMAIVSTAAINSAVVDQTPESASDLEILPSKMALLLDQAYEMAQLSDQVDLPCSDSLVKATWRDVKGRVVQQMAIAPLLQQASRSNYLSDYQTEMGVA